MISVKNIALLTIVIGLVLLIIQTNEPFDPATRLEGEECLHNKGAENNSTQCVNSLHCVHENGFLVNALFPAGKCKTCTNSTVGNGYPFLGVGESCTKP